MALVHCGGDQVRQASETLARALADSAPRPRIAAASTRGATAPVFFLDASKSMMGFAGCKANPSEFDVTIDHLTVDLSIDSVVRFGELVRGAGHEFERLPLTKDMHCGAFYNRQENPDYSLYRAVEQDSLHGAFLYITDGVQSDFAGSNQSPSVTELKSWIANGNALAILAFRSHFSGPAWSEQRQQMLGTVRVANRPFYAFLFTRNEQTLDSLLTHLSPETLANVRIMRFSPRSVTCSAAVGSRLPKYRILESPPWALIRYQALTNEHVVAEYRCAVRPDYPLQTVLLKPTVEYRAWEDGKAFGAAAAPAAGFALSGDSVGHAAGQSTVYVKGTFPFDAHTRYGFFAMRFAPVAGRLKDSLAVLSTDSDAEPSTFDKTYRFSWLLEQLVQAHIDAVPWSPLALTLQYR